MFLVVNSIFFQAEDVIRDFCLSRGLGDVDKIQPLCPSHWRFTIESSLCCTTDAIEALAPHIDEWIVDVKDMNSYIYREYTSAEPVVKERLAELMKLVPEEKIRVKVPLIPDFNTDADVERSVDELRAMGLTHIERTEYIVKPSK